MMIFGFAPMLAKGKLWENIFQFLNKEHFVQSPLGTKGPDFKAIAEREGFWEKDELIELKTDFQFATYGNVAVEWESLERACAEGVTSLVFCLPSKNPYEGDVEFINVDPVMMREILKGMNVRVVQVYSSDTYYTRNHLVPKERLLKCSAVKWVKRAKVERIQEALEYLQAQ